MDGLTAVVTDNDALEAYVFLLADPSDFDADGDTDGADLALLLAAWGASNPLADITGDGVVDGADLAALLAAWT